MKKYLYLGLIISSLAFAASSFTTYFNLEKPQDGDTTWGDAFRANMDTIDTQLNISSGATSAIAAHLADTTDAHDASAISANPGSTFCAIETNVQDYLDCLESNIGGGGGGSIAIGSPIVSAIAGSVFFAGAGGILAQDNAGIFWDDAANRLGIGTNVPSVPLHIRKAGSASPVLILDGTTDPSNGVFMQISSDTTAHSMNLGYSLDGVTAAIEFNGGTDSIILANNGILAVEAASDLQLTGGTARINLDTASGFTGISSGSLLTPTAQLDVNGGARIRGLSTAGPVITGATGVLSSEAFLDRTRGGTGISSTATFPSSGVIATDPLTTRGDINYRNSSNVTARLPVGAASTMLTSDGTDPSYTLIPDGPTEITNITTVSSVGSSALTIEVKTKGGSAHSSTDVGYLGVRSATLSSGVYLRRSITAAVTNLTVPSTATLGFTSGTEGFVYIYLIDNAGTLELAVAGRKFDEGELISTTAIDTASDSRSVMYSNTARSSVGFRLIAKHRLTEATAGTWASNPTAISNKPFETIKYPTFQKFTSGSGTYITPAGVTSIKVFAVGGGGGGEATGAGPTPPTNGGDTTFGTSLITAGGGTLSSSLSTGVGPAGGTATATGLTALLVRGGHGQAGVNADVTASSVTGGSGGNSCIGGGASGSYTVDAADALANTGGGGGGASSPSTTGLASGGGGGGGGGCVTATITDPLSSYSYAVGAGGTGGTAASFQGGDGGSGQIYIEEYYQ